MIEVKMYMIIKGKRIIAEIKTTNLVMEIILEGIKVKI
jgi:hypothetical protein